MIYTESIRSRGGKVTMERWIRRCFKEEPDYAKEEVRVKVGFLVGLSGVVFNLLLTVTKITVGILTSSIAVMADGFNNLSDAASSVITILGFKLSSIPPDREHPQGHGRMEYIAALMISAMVVVVGLNFVKNSVLRILRPENIGFSYITLSLLIFSVFLKVYLVYLNHRMGEKIDSTVLKATAEDARWDVVINVIVVFSLIFSRFSAFPADGYIGLLVSMMIIRSGYGLVRETVSRLLGEAPDPLWKEEIEKEILAYPEILGVHDVFFHNYGVSRTVITADTEVSAEIDLVHCHRIINLIEKKVADKYGVDLVIHVDPIGRYTEEELALCELVKGFVQDRNHIKSYHDLAVFEMEGKKCVEIYLIIDGNRVKADFDLDRLGDELREMVLRHYPDSNPIVSLRTEWY